MRRDDEQVLDRIAREAERIPWGGNWTVGGVIEALEPMVGEVRQARIRTALDQRVASVTVVLDSPYDPHNGAAVMRSCDAFGVQEMHVVLQREFLVSRGVAQGTQRWIDVVEHNTPNAALQTLKEQGFQLVVAHPEGTLVPADLAKLPKVALVLGNEHEGVGTVLTEAADHTVSIPMRGFVESLNMSVSAAILLEASVRDRPGDLDPNVRQHLYARGLYFSVKRAKDILQALEPR